MKLINYENVLKKILFFFFIMLSLGSYAQEIVKGVIKSSNDLPLPGVAVVQLGTSNGTVTDFDGNYEITLKPGSKTLVYRYIGFVSVERPINSSGTVNITLKEDIQSLNEVVVIGYGAVKREDVTGAISSVKSKDLEDQFYTSITETLQGQASGVLVSQDSGEPGGGISVNIRGINSISGSSQPLYVINGIPLGLDTQAEGDNFFTSTNPLADLNPDDIESIEVLKDASATAIYGARAGNGVVLIKTKEAKVGKTRIEMSFKSSISSIGLPYELATASQFAQFANDRTVLQTPQLTYQQLVDDDRIQFDGSEPNRPLPENAGVGTNFMDAIFRQGFNNTVNFSISGGTKAFSQLLSVNYNQNEGNIINSVFRRMNLRYNSKMKVGDNFTLNTNLQLNNTKNQRVQTSARSGLAGVVFSAMRINPYVRLFDEAGDLNEFDQEGEIVQNPLIEATQADNVVRGKSMIFSTSGVYNLAKGLNWTNRIGFNYNNNTNQSFQNKKTRSGRNANGRLFLSDAETNRFTAESFVNYNNQNFNSHNINVTAGASYTDVTSFRKSTLYNDFTFDDLGVDAIQLAGTISDPKSFKSNNYIQSLLFRFVYSYKKKYTFTATGRNDGDSKFSQGEPWGFFPSAALSWDINKEGFMKKIRSISQFKLRVSYGEVGSSIGVGPYSTLDTYAIGRIGLTDNTLNTATFSERIANKNLTWETSRTLNLGVNLNFFKNRLRTSVDVYERITDNLLNNLQIPLQNGFGSIPINDGELENRGIEIDLGYDIFNNEKFSWTTKLNWTKNVTKLIEYGTNEFIQGPNLATNFFGIDGTRTAPGQELGLFYGYKVTGLIQVDDLVDYANGNFNIRTEPGIDSDGNPVDVQIFATTARNNNGNGNPQANTPGLWKFDDLNGDGVISIEDRQVIGNPNPDFFFGWNNQFKIGDFNISMFVQGSFGNDILNLNRGFIGSGWVGANSSQDYLKNRWTLDDQHNDIRYPSNGSPEVVNIPNSVYVEDGSYVRLKNLSVRYNLRKVPFFKNASIIATGTNMVTITNYTGPDPEVSTNGNGALNRGIDYSAYPRPKVYTLGVNLTF
ncbi:TonB-linked outer membrane protein, SusC/RagA family [Algibacter lectus]|uniref:SusC/RagA family TonB-linked outer membrane protein n=1 Tax=Algibacter lectus TaxID=221126 RepID=UPI0008ED9E55|nr:TonB-dependent receptor [Algibacter lectus]SFB94087.1 TonB-linked outer membrane protein, SusC/RagA family [Algibacter lectus]